MGMGSPQAHQVRTQVNRNVNLSMATLKGGSAMLAKIEGLIHKGIDIFNKVVKFFQNEKPVVKEIVANTAGFAACLGFVLLWNHVLTLSFPLFALMTLGSLSFTSWFIGDKLSNKVSNIIQSLFQSSGKEIIEGTVL